MRRRLLLMVLAGGLLIAMLPGVASAGPPQGCDDHVWNNNETVTGELTIDPGTVCQYRHSLIDGRVVLTSAARIELANSVARGNFYVGPSSGLFLRATVLRGDVKCADRSSKLYLHSGSEVKGKIDEDCRVLTD